MSHKVTVTIPSYRQPDQLARALRALQAQTFKDFEVVILDDASGVDFFQLINDYSKTLDISVEKNEKNLGAMLNMFKSITFTTDSEYVFSHHEDDYLKINYIEEAVKILDNNPLVSFVVSSAEWISKDTPYQERAIIAPHHKIFTAKDFMVASLQRETFIFGSVIYRRNDLYGSFDLDTYHTLCDKIFLAEILLRNNSCCAFIPTPAIYVRDHSLDAHDKRSNGSSVEHIVNYFNFYKKHLASYPKINKLITNGLLLGYSNLPAEKSLLELYRKQKKYKLLSFWDIDIVGIYSLCSLILGKKISRSIMKMKSLRKTLNI